MLLTLLLGAAGTLSYTVRSFLMRTKTAKSGGAIALERKDYVFFSDSKRYWNVFEPICEAFEEKKIEAQYLSMSRDDPAFEKNYKYVSCQYIGDGNMAFAKLNSLSADIVISTTPGLDVYQWKRSKNVKRYVHVLHAPSDVTAYRMFGIDFYDSILLSGEYQVDQIRKLEKLRNLPPKETVIVGIPYMDERLKRLEKQKEGRREKTILVAPSWGDNSLLNRYGEKIIDGLLDTGYRIIIRPHPQSFISEKKMIERLMKKYPSNEHLEWNKDNDNFAVLNKSDIMISDFSGVIFDFALIFDKPVIYADTSFDPAPLDCCWLDEDLWTFQILPRIGYQMREADCGNMKEVIDRCAADPKLSEGREQARRDTWMFRGEGTERTLNYLLDLHGRIMKEKEA